jgi:hypothetical protein
MLPAFLIMLALAAAYVAFGALAAAQSAFYGIGPVVVGIFAASIYRLGKNTIKERTQIAILIGAAAVILLTPVGLVATLLAAGCTGIALFHSRRTGLISLALLIAAVAAYRAADILIFPSLMPATGLASQSNPVAPGLWELGTFFLKDHGQPWKIPVLASASSRFGATLGIVLCLEVHIAVTVVVQSEVPSSWRPRGSFVPSFPQSSFWTTFLNEVPCSKVTMATG